MNQENNNLGNQIPSNNQNMNPVNPATAQFQAGANNNVVQNSSGQASNVQPQQNMYQQSVQQPAVQPQPVNPIPQQPQMINPNYGQPNYQNYNSNSFGQPINNGKKNNKKYLLLLVLVLVIVSGIGLIFLNINKKSVSRTIMIYMVGSNLESNSGLATVDLNSIDYDQAKSQNTNVLLIAGGSLMWQNDYIDVNETSIYELTENGFTKVEEQNRQNMGDSSVLSNFLTYVYDNYKTDKYDLIFWNHGGAIQGSEYDDLNDGDNLSLYEFSLGLEASPFNQDNKLELVIFRTCLNGTIEVASIFNKYSEYLVASEEVTMGAAWTSVLSFVNDINSEDTSIEVAKKYINSYKKQMQDIIDVRKKASLDVDSIYSTYSLIDLSKVQTLRDSVNEFFEDINVSSNYNLIAKVRANLRQYGTTVPHFDMVDLYNLVNELKELSPSKAEKVFDDFEDAVVYNWATNPESRGLSIYFPYRGNKDAKQMFLATYNGFDGFTSYKNFINEFYNIQISGKSATSYLMNDIKSEKSTDENESIEDFSLELTDEQLQTFAKATYIVYRDNKDGYFKPIYSGGQAKLEGNILKASIRDRQLRITSKAYPGESLTLFSIETDNTDKYINYEIPIVLENFTDWKSDQAIMNLAYDKKTKKIDIVAVLYDEGELANTAVVDLSKYDDILFSVSSGWSILDEDGNYVGPQDNENGGVKGDGIITGWEDKPENIEFELESFDDDYDYYCVFKINDVYNNVSYSKLVKMN